MAPRRMDLRRLWKRKALTPQKEEERQIIEKIAERRRGIQAAEREWLEKGGKPEAFQDTSGRGKGVIRPVKAPDRRK